MKLLKMLTLMFVFAGLLAGCAKDELEINNPEPQLKSADSRTINFDWTGEYYTPVICDGDTVDFLYAPDVTGQNVHITAHLINGQFVWMIVHSKLTITGLQTGETFKINDQTKVNFDENEEYETFTMHIHVKGDKGTHVIMFFDFDWASQTLDFTKGICPQNVDE
ncbi:MAG TPA: hypothetical protein PK335_10645 [Draconibacterium sp.]|nr:hypothetical protein [Draconibacterium sp.]